MVEHTIVNTVVSYIKGTLVDINNAIIVKGSTNSEDRLNCGVNFPSSQIVHVSSCSRRSEEVSEWDCSSCIENSCFGIDPLAVVVQINTISGGIVLEVAKVDEDDVGVELLVASTTNGALAKAP